MEDSIEDYIKISKNKTDENIHFMLVVFYLNIAIINVFFFVEKRSKRLL